MRTNVLKDKSFEFALDVVNTCKILQIQKEYVISRQILRSGTAIGAMVSEAEHAESRKDFIHKLSISQKEANETSYWLKLLHRSEYIDSIQYSILDAQLVELLRLLTSIILTNKRLLQ